MLSNKEKYRQFCEAEKELPIFMQHWWLDAVCGEDGWDTAIVEQEGGIIGVLPYCLTKKYIFKLIIPPHLTRWMGPWVKFPDDLENRKKLSLEYRIYEELINQLPRSDWMQIGCPPTTTNLKAFFWNGFVQSVRYVSIVEKNGDLDSFFNKLPNDPRNSIRKAANSYNIVNDFDIDIFLELLKEPYKRQQLKFDYPDPLIKQLFEKSTKHDAGIVIGAENKATKKIDSVIFCVWDSKYFYFLMSGGNETARNNYAMYLLAFEAIKLAWSKNLIFSFDGSMKRTIDTFNRKFSTKEIAYFELEKINSKILKCYLALK